jgi:hypothetical protein
VDLKSWGVMAVDWEQRVDFDRLRRARLARIQSLLKESSLGSLLCFDNNNIRYVSSSHIGTWSIDKQVRWSLLPQGTEPVVWDFGSVVGRPISRRHHEL